VVGGWFWETVEGECREEEKTPPVGAAEAGRGMGVGMGMGMGVCHRARDHAYWDKKRGEPY
jgi:hypothetical protein